MAMNSHRFLALFLLLLVTWTMLTSSFSSLQNNLFSVRYLMIATQPTTRSIDLPSTSPRHGRGDLLKARLALAEERYDIVLANTLEAVESGDVLAGTLAGQAYLRMGDDVNAIDVWAQVGDVDSLYNTGLTRQAENKPDEALLFLWQAYESDNEKATLYLATVLRAQGMTSEAIGVLNTTLTNHDKSPLRHLWMSLLVDLLRQEQKWPDALDVLARWENEFPDNIYVFIRRGWIFYEIDGSFQKAAQQFEHAISLAPDNGHGYLNMGLLLTYHERYSDAKPYYGQAVYLSPDNLEWLFAQAQNLQLAEEPDKALALYEQIVERDPTHTRALQAIKYLQTQ